MTPGQKKTAFGIGVWAVSVLLGGFWLLYVELAAAGRGDGTTISELTWIVWAHQPGVVFVVTHTLAAPFWFLMGHFFWQSKSVYRDIRKEDA